MITTTTSGSYTADPYASYVTIPNAGSFYSGGRLNANDLNATYTFQIMDDVSAVQQAPKEHSMNLSVKTTETVYGRHLAEVYLNGKLLFSEDERDFKTAAKAHAHGEKLIADAVRKLLGAE